jgi:uncharacterized membrane protein
VDDQPVTSEGDRPTDDDESVEVGSGRVEAFSDAVMAVIITIMAFQLRPPQGVSLNALQHQLPGVLVYVLSFTFIGIYWNNHHHLLRATKRISGEVMWANLLLLFWLSLVPVATEWLRTYYSKPAPAAAYGLISMAAALSFLWLVKAIIRANGRDSLVARATAGGYKEYASLAIYATGVVCAFISPWISYACYAGVSVMWIIPDRRLSRAKPSEPPVP